MYQSKIYKFTSYDFSKNSHKFNAYTIDFRGIDTPDGTYWYLGQWKMDLTNLKNNYTDVNGGTAYGGLQTTIKNRTAIMSIWEISYKENGVEKKIKANHMYPKGSENTFTNEGTGTNYISQYN